jgi:PAS domain S-box-containing protein
MATNSQARQERLSPIPDSSQGLAPPSDTSFDDLVQLAAELCAVPIAAIVLTTEERLWFKSSLGLPKREMELALALCTYAIRDTAPLIVPDLRQAPLFVQSLAVPGEPSLRFYAGVPLVSASGQVLGTLSVMDRVARQLTTGQMNSLQAVARQVVKLLELQRLGAQHEQLLAAHQMMTAQAQRQANQLVAVQQLAQMGTWEMELREKRLTWSDKLYQIFGIKGSETPISFASYRAFVHPDDLPALLEAQAKTLAGEGGYEIEYRILWPTGEVRHVHERAELQSSVVSQGRWLLGSVQDVTEQKRTLRLIESFFDLSIALLGIMRLDGRFTKVNRTFERTLGRSAEELTSLPFVELVHVDDRARTLAKLQQFSAADRSVDFEARCLAQDGSYRLISWSALPVAEDGVVYCIGRDITEANETREALRASEERFRQMAEIVDEVFWIYQPATDRIIYASPRYEMVFGASREALYDDPRSYQRNVHPEDLPRLRAATARDRDSVDIDYRLLLPSGEIRWINVRSFAIRDANDNVTHSVGIARDITLLVQTTQQLRASEEQYRLLFTHNPHPMWVYDYHTLQFLAVNEAAIAQYGYSEAEFLAMTLNDIRPLEENKVQIEQWLATGQHLRQRVEAIWRHRRKDGTLIDVESVSDVIEFDGRQARIALANNISKRLRAEAQVREQAALLDKAQDAIMVRDLSHRITYWNRSAERLYGWRAEEVIGQRVDELLHKDRSAFQKAHEEVMARGEWVGELQKVDRNGRILLVEGRWTLVRDEGGKPRAILTINTDITERRQLEAHFLRAQRMESIGTLAGGIAHDLNNVLAPILLSLGMLKRQSRTPSELKQLNILETSAQRGADLVRQVLAFARGADGERTIVNIAQVVKDLEPLIRDTFDRNIRFIVQIDSDLPSLIGDPTQIHQVLLNLCLNARDAMPEGGRLQVSVSTVNLDSQYMRMHPVAEPGRYVVLKVSDTGIGIPQANRERIFDPFFTTKDVGKGTGLGLATVQAVVNSHGGFIDLYSEEGRGTQFNVYLPALEDGQLEDITAAPASLPAGHNELVLVVDDETAVRLTTQQVLEAQGYRVLIAEDGAEAVTRYEQHRDEIAVVITDMMMPGMNGLATIEALQKINPNIRIIAASGLAAYDMVAKAASLGIQHFLPKPYTAEALFKILAESLTAS